MNEIKEFPVNATTKVGFGKLKGRPHSAFFEKANEKYKVWILNQGDEFRYKSTRDWIIRQSGGGYIEPKSLLVTFVGDDDKPAWRDLKNKIDEILQGYENFHSVFEF